MDANLTGASLANAGLNVVNFTGADMGGTNLNGAEYCHSAIAPDGSRGLKC